MKKHTQFNYAYALINACIPLTMMMVINNDILRYCMIPISIYFFFGNIIAYKKMWAKITDNK